MEKLGKIYGRIIECTDENLASHAERAAVGWEGEQSELNRITRDLSGISQGECDAVKDKDAKRIMVEDKRTATKMAT